MRHQVYSQTGYCNRPSLSQAVLHILCYMALETTEERKGTIICRSLTNS